MIFHYVLDISFDVFFEVFRIGSRHFAEVLEGLLVLAGKLIIVIIFPEQQAYHLATQKFFPDDIVSFLNPGNGKHGQNQKAHIAQQGIHPGHQLGEATEATEIAQKYNADDIAMHFADIITSEPAGCGIIKAEGRIENQGKDDQGIDKGKQRMYVVDNHAPTKTPT